MFCQDHFLQPFALILAIVGPVGLFAGLYTDVSSIWGSLRGSSASPPFSVVAEEAIQSKESPAASGDAGLSSDPYLYISFDGFPPDREQECPGLLGICLYQDISAAIDALGVEEQPGFPQPAIEGEGRCHLWAPRRISRVSVCEDESRGIYSISVKLTENSMAQISLPRSHTVYLPTTLGEQSDFFIEAFDARPHTMQKIDGEGGDFFSFAWDYPSQNEGTPSELVEITGFRPWQNGEILPFPEQCDFPAYYSQSERVGLQTITVQVVGTRPEYVEEFWGGCDSAT